MTVIRVAENGERGDGPFQALIGFSNGAEYEITVASHADAEAESELEWYFQEHLKFPFLDADREQAARDRIIAYGHDLFSQVFGGAAHYDYRRLRDTAFDGCRLEVSGSARFHALHWEALRDPAIPDPLVIRLPVTRRVGRLASKWDVADDQPTLNILVVTARPDGPRDVGYRTISRPLLDGLRRARVPVTVDLLRPGTWEALTAHMRAATDEHGSGWYQVVHFDLHGAVADFGQLLSGAELGSLTFATSPVGPYDGERPFLFFETAEQDTSAPVSAQAVADLLAAHRVPVAVLNACQSARQTAASEASLAQHLAEAGVPVAVGMAYSVTVTAAAQAMPVFYENLAGGADPTAAVQAARRELFERKRRRAYFNQTIELEDWMLPVAFVQRSLTLRARGMTGAEENAFYERESVVGDEPPTTYGFVGRDLDIQSIERALLATADNNELLVQGLAGAGKSTLLAHLGWWWKRTGLVSEVFSYTYERQAWTTDEMIRDIRSRLLPVEEQARADAMSAEAQLEHAARLLRASRHLLILDNAESITASAASIPHALDAAEQDRLKRFLSRLRGGRTLVLIGSREAEEWLTADGRVAGSYRLPGLDPQASSTLVQRILVRHGADRYLRDPHERQALRDLMALLGGYPLALTVVVPVLATTPPSTVLAELREGGASADPVGQIAAAIEYSHGRLDPVIQNSLLLLAPFTGVIPLGPPLAGYQEAISATPAAQPLGTIDLAAAVEHAVRVGLAAPYPLHTGFVQVQPVLPYFLRGKLRDLAELRRQADRWHYELYLGMSCQAIDMLDAQDDPERRLNGLAIVEAEYANVRAALDFGLREGLHIGPIVEVLEEYLDQTEQPVARRALIDEAIATHVAPRTREQISSLASLHGLASIIALHEHRLADARRHCDASLPLYEALGNKRNQLAALRQFGQVAHREGDLPAAAAAYEQALRIAAESGDKHQMAGCHLSLGDVASDQEEFITAKSHYQEAVTSYAELGQRHAVANCLLNFATAASKQGTFSEAESAYRQASEVYAEFKDERGLASTTLALGELADKRQDLGKAETLYREALKLYFRFSDQVAVATVFCCLADVAVKRGRLAEAAANFDKALEIYLAAGQEGAGAGVCVKLAAVAKKRGLPSEQEARLRQAASLACETGNPGDAAEVFLGLSRLALAQGRHDQGALDRRTAIDLFRQADDEEAVNEAERSFRELDGFVTAAEGKLQSLAANEGTGDLAALGRRYHDHAKLAEQLGEFGVALADYRQARDTFETAGNAAGAADAYYHIGVFAMENADYHEAGDSFARSAGLHVEAGEWEYAAYRYDGVGACAQRVGRLGDAEAAFLRALEIRLEIGDEAGAAQSRYVLAMTALERDLLDDAATEFDKALDYYRTTDAARAVEIITRLGWIATLQHRHTVAAVHYQAALRLAQENGSPVDLLVVTYGLADAADGIGQAERAVGLYKRALQLAQEKGNDSIAAIVDNRLAELAADSASQVDANPGTGADTSDL